MGPWPERRRGVYYAAKAGLPEDSPAKPHLRRQMSRSSTKSWYGTMPDNSTAKAMMAISREVVRTTHGVEVDLAR